MGEERWLVVRATTHFDELLDQVIMTRKPVFIEGNAGLRRSFQWWNGSRFRPSTGSANFAYRHRRTLWISEITRIVASSIDPSLRHENQPWSAIACSNAWVQATCSSSL